MRASLSWLAYPQLPARPGIRRQEYLRSGGGAGLSKCLSAQLPACLWIQSPAWLAFFPERNKQLKWSILVLGLILTSVWLGGDGGCPVIFEPTVARGVQVVQNIEIIRSLGSGDRWAEYLILFKY